VSDQYPFQMAFVSAMPAIAGFTVAGSAPGLPSGSENWVFSGELATMPELAGPPEFWTYAFSETSGPLAPIPLPASVVLMAAGLAGLAALPGRRLRSGRHGAAA
jgi:hypothetical protein